ELVVAVGLRKNRAGEQHYTACGLYDLSSRGVLTALLDDGSTLLEQVGPLVQAEVPCRSYMEIKLDTKVTWFLRMPGDYYGRVIEGTVHASHPVHITFSDFGELQNASN